MYRLIVMTCVLGFAIAACPAQDPGPQAEEVAPVAKTEGGGETNPAPRAESEGNFNRAQPPQDLFADRPDGSVTLSGTVSYDGEEKGDVFVEIGGIVPDGSTGKVAHSEKLGGLGKWSIEAPKGFGPVMITAYLDPNGDGPTQGEPIAVMPGVEIGDADLTGLDLVLSTEHKRIEATVKHDSPETLDAPREPVPGG